MFSTTTFSVDTGGLSSQAPRWMVSNTDAARAFRRLMLRPAEYASAARLPRDLPAALVEKFAASPRTAHLVSAVILSGSALDIRPTRPDSLSIRLALLEGDVLIRLARMIGVAWIAPVLNATIDGPTLERITETLGPELLEFARDTAPLLRPDDVVECDVTSDQLLRAVEGAGYRTLLEALYGEPPWVSSRFRLKCPQPLDDRINLKEVSIESTFALAIRVARQLPAPWSTLFAPKAA